MKFNLLLAVAGTVTSFALVAQTPCEDGMAGIYPCNHVDLLAFMSLDDISAGSNTNDIWGWKSPVTGKEYALVGCQSGTAFVDISDPVNPVFLGLLYSHTNASLWRDVEEYGNFAFIVSEASGHGLQVFDLLQLDEVTNPPVSFEEAQHYDGFGHCHTIDICEETGYAYCNGTSTFSGGQHIVNISNPINPTLAGSFSDDGYTHDCHAIVYDGPDTDYQGSEIVMACNEDALTVVNCTDKTDCYAISINEYPQTGYTHQGWFTKDKRFFLVNDELDEMDFDVNTRTHLFDVQDLDNVQYLGFYQGAPASIDHNLYIQDQFVYQSNYTSGVRILDAIRAEDGVLSELAYFDLFPTSDNPVFQGTWSCYPFLPSGVLLATSMYNGFFILRPRLLETSQQSWQLCGDDALSFELNVRTELDFPLTSGLNGLPETVTVSSATITASGTYVITISNLLTLAPGLYNFNLVLINAAGNTYELPLALEISEGAAEIPVTLAPAENFSFSSLDNIVFEWNAQANASNYHFQLATDAAFTSIIDEQEVAGTTYDPLFDLPAGNYFWRVMALNECGSSPYSETATFSVLPVGVETLAEGSFLMFPNPASDHVFIASPGAPGERLLLADAAGRIVKRVDVNGAGIQVDVSDLAAGIYLVRCRGSQAVLKVTH